MIEPTVKSKADLRAFVANCLMGGDTVTETPDGWIRDVVVFECGGRCFQFRQKPEVIAGQMDQFVNQFVETTEVLVADVEEGDVQEVKNSIGRICWLLSFAGTCRVISFGHEYPNGSGLMHSISVSGVAQDFRPVFNMRDGAQVKSFVEQTYDNYVRLEQSRKLNVIFDYLARGEERNQAMEVRTILSFVALESLKYTYALTKPDKYLPKKSGNGFIKSEKNRKGNDVTWEFSALVKDMLNDVGMVAELSSAYGLRNNLIHSGLPSIPFAEQLRLYEDVHDLIREYLLRLLGYRGHYSPYAFERRGMSAEIK